jgi:hypothetical protein
VSFKKYESQGKAVEVTVNSKEENSSDFCLDFVQEFGLKRINTVKRKTDTKIQLDNSRPKGQRPAEKRNT